MTARLLGCAGLFTIALVILRDSVRYHRRCERMRQQAAVRRAQELRHVRVHRGG